MFCDKVVMLKDQHIYACGYCREVITGTNIEAVYDVKTEVHQRHGKPHVLLIDG